MKVFLTLLSHDHNKFLDETPLFEWWPYTLPEKGDYIELDFYRWDSNLRAKYGEIKRKKFLNVEGNLIIEIVLTEVLPLLDNAETKGNTS